MKVYEYFAQFAPEQLLHQIGVVDVASQIADRLQKCGEKDLASVYLDIVEHFTKMLNDEARPAPYHQDIIERSSGLLSHFSNKPTTLQAIVKATGEDKKALYRQVKKLVEEGKVTKVSNKRYVLATPPTVEPPADDAVEPIN
jgi:predicted Rossmann fold nucleotide-binding protein DprA/Smf involved in DNA uptake